MGKNFSFRKVSLLIFLLGGLACHGALAQSPEDTKDVNAHSPHSSPGNKQQRKADKKKADQKAELNRAIEKGRKQHEKIQTKEVRKRMKQSKHRADLNNSHQKEFFLKRWFTPKHNKKRR